MSTSLVVSRAGLVHFLTCRRRFQLRYLEEAAWPAEPPDAGQAEALRQGQTFHQLAARHLLGLTAGLPSDEPLLAGWFRDFQAFVATLPAGDFLPEISLTVPVGRHYLTGRFDLLLFAGEQVLLFDWKTERRPRDESALRQEWQTRLYLALVAAGGAALRPGSPTPPPSAGLRPETIRLTYWFAQAPEAPVTIAYDGDTFAADWAALEATTAALFELQRSTGAWPLTDDWSACSACPYRRLCGRQAAPPTPLDLDLWATEAQATEGSLTPTWQ